MVHSRTSPGSDPAPVRLVDPMGRRLDYLRLSVTDRCNLRCQYCMPADGVRMAGRGEILSYEESLRLARVFGSLGVRKIRVTGGEPLVRNGVVPFMAALADLPARPEILLTTNGLLLERHLDDLVAAGLRRVNLSLDSLDPATWRRVTRRDGHAVVLRAIDAVLERNLELKLNVVVVAGLNDHELPDFVAFTRDRPVTVRFIEAMPFNGESGGGRRPLTGEGILRLLRGAMAAPADSADFDGVARVYRIPGHAGRIGIIAGHSRTFCSSCSRLRLDARGRLRTCLYGRPGPDLRRLLRCGADDHELAAAITGAVAARAVDGHQAARHAAAGESMASIGG